MANKLSTLLRELRGNRPLREISDMIYEKTGEKLSHAYIRNLEKGIDRRTKQEITPSPKTLRLLSEVYNYSYDKLMVMAGHIDPSDNKDERDNETKRVDSYIFQKRTLGILSKNNISYKKLADDLETSVESVRERLEDPDKISTCDIIEHYASSLNVTPDYLMGYTDEPNSHSEDTPRPKEIMEAIYLNAWMHNGYSLTENDKRAIHKLLDTIKK